MRDTQKLNQQGRDYLPFEHFDVHEHPSNYLMCNLMQVQGKLNVQRSTYIHITNIIENLGKNYQHYYYSICDVKYHYQCMQSQILMQSCIVLDAHMFLSSLHGNCTLDHVVTRTHYDEPSSY